MPGVDAFIKDLPSQIVLGILVNGVTAMLVWSGGQVLGSLRKSGKDAASGLGNAAGFVEATLTSAFSVVSVNPLLTLWRGLIWVTFVLGMIGKYLGTVIFLYAFFAAYFSQVDGATPRAIWVLPGLIVGVLLVFKPGRMLIGGIGTLLVAGPFLYFASMAGVNIGYWLMLPCAAFSSLFFDVPIGEIYQNWLGGMGPLAHQSLFLEQSLTGIAGNLAYEWRYYGLAPMVVYACLLVGLLFSFSVVIVSYISVWNNLPPGKTLGPNRA